MIAVQVKLKGLLAWMAPQADLRYQMEAGSTLTDLLNHLANTHGSRFQKTLLDRQGRLDPAIAVKIGQQVVSGRHADRIRLENDCRVTVFPLAAGG